MSDSVCRRLYSTLSVNSLVDFSIFGICGILPDLDHLIEGWARHTHAPLAIASWMCCILYCALVRGLLYHSGMKDGKLGK